MEFQAKGLPIESSGFSDCCQLLGSGQAELWAILSVETSGFGYLSDRRPRILYERHYFHRLTNGIHDDAAPDISNAERGGYIGGAAEYERLAKAIALDRTAALKSASWGIGQLMGANHVAAGYATVDDMVNAFVAHENNQLQGMAKFILNSGLADNLHAHNWTGFAKGYNGAAYLQNQYDTKLQAAYQKAQQQPIDLKVRTAQIALIYLGYKPGPVDGILGSNTKNAIIAFQQKYGVTNNGTLDDGTMQLLTQNAFGG